MGRNQDPPELHLLKGTKSRVKRESGTLEPLEKMWPCPDYVWHPEAKRLFNELGTVLIEKGILTALDQSAFEMLCSSWGHIQSAREILKTEGFVIDDMRGSKKLHPATRILSMAQKHFQWFSGHFGLTPAARKRMGIVFEPSKDNDDRWDKFQKT